MFPLVRDRISGQTPQPTRDGTVALRPRRYLTQRGEFVILGQDAFTADRISGQRPQPTRGESVAGGELVVLGQVAGRGPWLQRGNASQAEATQAVQELNRRNIFSASQGGTVTPDEALKWGVNFALYHYDPKYQTGWDNSKPWVATVRYAQKQYLSDANFIKKVRRSIAGARLVVGKVMAEQNEPRWGGHRARSNVHEPPVSDIIRRAAGIV